MARSPSNSTSSPANPLEFDPALSPSAVPVRRSPTPPSASKWCVSNTSRFLVHLNAILFSPLDPGTVAIPRRVDVLSLADSKLWGAGKARMLNDP
jgi:hypothetical protein